MNTLHTWGFLIFCVCVGVACGCVACVFLATGIFFFFPMNIIMKIHLKKWCLFFFSFLVSNSFIFWFCLWFLYCCCVVRFFSTTILLSSTLFFFSSFLLLFLRYMTQHVTCFVSMFALLLSSLLLLLF